MLIYVYDGKISKNQSNILKPCFFYSFNWISS